MRRQVQEILRRFGQSVVLRPDRDAAESRAFLQPAARESERMPGEMTVLGAVDRRLWLYLGSEEAADGDSVLWNGRTFRVCSSRPWYAGEELVYWWAVLELEKEAGP